MICVGLRMARQRWSEFVRRAAGGEEIVVTRRGEPVARLVPPHHAELAAMPAHALAARIRQSRAAHALGAGATLRQMLEEGRR